MLKKEANEQQFYDELKKYITINDGAFMNLGQLLSFAAQRFPKNIALVSGTQTITYEQLFYRASLFSKILKERGIKARDRVLLFLKIRLNFTLAIMVLHNWGLLLRHLISI